LSRKIFGPLQDLLTQRASRTHGEGKTVRLPGNGFPLAALSQRGRIPPSMRHCGALPDAGGTTHLPDANLYAGPVSRQGVLSPRPGMENLRSPRKGSWTSFARWPPRQAAGNALAAGFGPRLSGAHHPEGPRLPRRCGPAWDVRRL